jgi:hypothetical protein
LEVTHDVVNHITQFRVQPSRFVAVDAGDEIGALA